MLKVEQHPHAHVLTCTFEHEWEICIKSARVTFLGAGVSESNSLVYEPKVCVFKKTMALKCIYIFIPCACIYVQMNIN